jgi:hypothetical protein
MYVYIYIYVYIYMCTYMYIYMCIYVYICIYIYVYICIYKYVNNNQYSQPRTIGCRDCGRYVMKSDDDVYLSSNMAVGYKIYLHTRTNQPERYKYKIKKIKKIN